MAVITKTGIFTKEIHGFETTGTITRSGPSEAYPTTGILYMKNCPDGKSFLCETDTNGKAINKNYYKLLDPTTYGITPINNGNVYVYIDTSFMNVIDIKEQKPIMMRAIPQQDSKNQQSDLYRAVKSNSSNIAEDVTFDANKISNNVPTHSLMSKYNPLAQYISVNEYSRIDLSVDIKAVEKSLNLASSSSAVAEVKRNMIHKFNRFLIAYPDLRLPKSFAHIFFSRPELNLYTSSGALISGVANDPTFLHIHNTDPDLLKSLTKNMTTSHLFNPILSNKAESFELKDESINTMEYGETYTGYKIMYGKHKIASETADRVSISFTDDNQLSVYKIHKAWVDYISKVYRGELYASDENIKNRVLDYAASIYYIVCGPDGETVLFWSKYTGVFPTDIPSSTFSWQKGKTGDNPEYSISYCYAWKEDFNPLIIDEFNKLSGIEGSTDNIAYAKTYNSETLSIGKTFTNAPFIELVTNSDGTYDYKLRFRA